jgi:hypothetical protein
MKYLILSCLLLGGCTTVVPVVANFPEPPGQASLSTCVDLQKLEESAKLSDISKTIANNYTKYYECSIKNDTWIEWYKTQKKLFEQVSN